MYDAHSTQEAFSHSASCITHEALTEQCTHSPFSLAASNWQTAQARVNKLLRLSFCLSFSSFCLSRFWHCSPGLEGMRISAGYKKTGSMGYTHVQCWNWARSPCWLCWWSWLSALCQLLQSSALQSALCLDSLTDLNLHTPRTRGIGALRIYHPQPRSTSSLSLLVCFVELSGFASLHPSPLGISFLTFPSALLPLSCLPFSPPVPLQLCSLLFSHVSLSVSPSLSFWDSIRALEAGERKQGGVKTSMVLFTKDPGIARR